jgi:hypothetical protein
MKMALKDGQILIKDADNMQFTIIKSWNKMKWSKAEQMLFGPADGELLNKLASLVTLPKVIEEERQRLNRITEAVDRERMTEEPVPLFKYPVKYPLFKHQTRGANMALITFGLIPPPEPEEPDENKINKRQGEQKV